jgi:type IV pilus assembly protein PilN
MLKINLLPDRRRDAAGGAAAGADNSRLFVGLLAGTLIVMIVGLFVFHGAKVHDVTEARIRNNTKQQEIRSIRSQMQDHQKIIDELGELHAREDAIGHLEGARTGPTSMLVELSHLLSPGGRPSADPTALDRVQRNNPTEMYNATWDPHRLWLSAFSEENRNVVIEGDGRTPDDVGEFMRRMMLSQYFEQVRLERSEGAIDQATRISVQRFKIVARVRY